MISVCSSRRFYKPEQRSQRARAPSCWRGSCLALALSHEPERYPSQNLRCCTIRLSLHTDTGHHGHSDTLKQTDCIKRGKRAVIGLNKRAAVLTMVDLKVVDSQSFKNGHTGFVDVQSLTQLRVCDTVHSADLDRQTTGWDRQAETRS